MRLTYAGLTHVGKVRSSNQDALYLPPPGESGPRVFVLADGMGGASGGEVASALAVDTIPRTFARGLKGSGQVGQALVAAVEEANRAIYQKAEAENSLWGMGTTVVAAALDRGRAQVANVGDSRLYLYRKGELRQVSRDHSLVAEEVARGLITPEEARHHQMRNVLTRAVGARSQVEVDLFTLELEAGDRLLLCSDGLHGPLPDRELARLLEDTPGVEQAAQTLIEAANQAGGPDNVSVILIQVDEPGAQGPGPGETTQKVRNPSAGPRGTKINPRASQGDKGTSWLVWSIPVLLALAGLLAYLLLRP